MQMADYIIEISILIYLKFRVYSTVIAFFGGVFMYNCVICRYHDPKTNNCIQYSKRCELVPSCLKLNPQNIGNIPWIPETCAYYILAKTGTLPAWHPLITGKPLPKEFMVPANSISELLVPEEELEDHIIEDYDDE